MIVRQLTFNDYDESINIHSPKIIAAVKKLSLEIGTESRGAIFTRSEVVDFMLDLIGYTENKQLHKLRLLEPSFGGGSFLLPAIDRLLKSWQFSQCKKTIIEDLGNAICAVELHHKTLEWSSKNRHIFKRLFLNAYLRRFASVICNQDTNAPGNSYKTCECI